ncbi:MAG TPA: lysophospholipid acyltransferase family protein [Polyangia bacterium]|jgi:1-acyl-sn-glycerol-3-phosphate acyltransferase|nr:lysophospholipid acyltransferase family protein [Polyangia bacterium]
MRSWLGKTWLRLNGWRIETESPQHPKFVLIAAPHTSNWDLPYMLAASYVMDLPLSWMGKHTLFSPPFGWVLKAVGGIPIDRRAKHNVVRWAIEQIQKSERLILVVPAKGTRGKADYWKSGFYHIALGAGVPIGMGYLDYGKKTCGIKGFIMPTGDVRADMDRIRAFYRDVEGKYPELGDVPRLREEDAPAAQSEAAPAPRTKAQNAS